MARQDGATTRQMQQAPQGAVFVWCNAQLHYPCALARFLGRPDLRIIRPDDLAYQRLAGLNYPAIVLDHAADLTGRQREEFQRAIARVRPTAPPATGHSEKKA